MKAAVAGVLLLLASVGSCSDQQRSPWDEVVERTHLGITCPNEAVKYHTQGGGLLIDQYYGEQCDRVGLALWLNEPASTVQLWLAGRPVQMRAAPPSSPDFTPPSPGPSSYFVGFKRPAGFRDGKLRVGREVSVRLIVEARGERPTESLTSIECCGGWG